MNKNKCTFVNKTNTKVFLNCNTMPCNDENIQHSVYENKKHYEPFDYLKKKDWNKFLEDKAEEIDILYVVGNVNINQKKYKEISDDYTKQDKLKDKKYGVLHIPYTQEYIDDNNLEYPYKDFDILESKDTKNNLFAKTVGYVQVDDFKYIRLIKHTFIPFILFWLCVIAIVCGLLFAPTENKIITDFRETVGNSITQQEEKPSGEIPMAENHYLYVWSKKTVTAESKTVPLVNHPDNDVYLCYDILDEQGNKLDSTGAFPPNTQVDYDFYELFNGKEGKYPLTLLVKVYDQETKEALCSKTMPVVIFVQ